MGRYSTPITGLISRLKYHTAQNQNPPRMLQDVKLVESPTKETEGKRDIPSLRIMIPDMNERFAPARNVDGMISMKIFVSTDRDKGIGGLYEMIDRVLDAMQTDANGVVSVLPGIARHFDCKIEEAHSTDVSMVAPLMLFLMPFKHEVGRRRTMNTTSDTRTTADTTAITADAG